MNLPNDSDLPEGRLDITLSIADGRVVDVRIHSRRPSLTQHLLEGRQASGVPALVGSLFSLCGQAQRMAADAAIEAALAAGHVGVHSPADHPHRNRRVLDERIREHVRHLTLPSPQPSTRPITQSLLAGLRRLATVGDVRPALSALLTEQVLGEPPADWLQRDPEGVRAWSEAGGTVAAMLLRDSPAMPEAGHRTGPLLPPLHQLRDEEIAEIARDALAMPDFCSRPRWQGQPAETGALSRQQSHALVSDWCAGHGRDAAVRYLARLVELVQEALAIEPAGPALGAWHLAPGLGVAGVETSRGLLLHVVQLDGDRVAEYRILAPTEWNFHPQGPLQAALANLPADARLETDACRIVHALDPCVAYSVYVREASGA